jgi:hypothetical protein
MPRNQNFGNKEVSQRRPVLCTNPEPLHMCTAVEELLGVVFSCLSTAKPYYREAVSQQGSPFYQSLKPGSVSVMTVPTTKSGATDYKNIVHSCKLHNYLQIR